MSLSRCINYFLIFAIILTKHATAHAQICQPVQDAQGRVEGWLNVDGTNYRLLTEEQFREILKKSTAYNALQQEHEQVVLKLKLKDDIISSKDNIIQLQSVEIATLREIEKLFADRLSPKWYEHDLVKVGGTFLITSAAFGYWSWTVRSQF